MMTGSGVVMSSGEEIRLSPDEVAAAMRLYATLKYGEADRDSGARIDFWIHYDGAKYVANVVENGGFSTMSARAEGRGLMETLDELWKEWE